MKSNDDKVVSELIVIECLTITVATKLLYPVTRYLGNIKRKVSDSIRLGVRDILFSLIVDVLIYLGCLFIYGRSSGKYSEIWGMLICVIVWSVLQIMASYVYLFIKRRKELSDMQPVCIISTLFPLLNLSIIPYVSLDVECNAYYIWLMIISGILADITLLYVVYTMSDVRKYKQSIHLNENELQLIESMSIEAKEDEEHLQNLRKKYQQELDDIYRMYVEDVDGVVCNECIEQLEQKIKGVADRKCSNVIVNTILNDKLKECEKLGIEFSCDVKLGENTGISNLNLCSIFTNLLNNATEACMDMESGKRYINVRTYVKGNYLNICVTNSFDEGKKRQEKRKGRGYGFKILEDIAAAYGGMFKFEYRRGEFSGRVSVLMNEDCYEGEL